MQEDKILISRFKTGEEEAFDRLMAAHLEKVFGFAWSMLLDREEAFDAVQEVFVRLHLALPNFRENSNLSAWLYRVCMNHCIDRKRRAKRAERTMTDEEWERIQGPVSSDPEWSAEQTELRETIRLAVETLPPRQRAAFIFRHYNLLTIKETAAVMGCSEGAVKAHLSRAAATLRGRLKEYVTPKF